MRKAKEVKVVFEKGFSDEFDAEMVRGVILEETEHFFVVGKIEKRVLIGKNYIIKIEDINHEKGLPPDFKFGRA